MVNIIKTADQVSNYVTKIHIFLFLYVKKVIAMKILFRKKKLFKNPIRKIMKI